MGLDLKTDRPTLDWQQNQYDELCAERQMIDEVEGRIIFEIKRAYRASGEFPDKWDEMLEWVTDQCGMMRDRLDVLEDERCPDRDRLC